jgi:nondiscriminating glutamyl-tRNA synthetase
MKVLAKQPAQFGYSLAVGLIFACRNSHIRRHIGCLPHCETEPTSNLSSHVRILLLFPDFPLGFRVMTIRTRFAPSPTGYLHIGGVRTALFCWLLAKRHGGKFILRIDDTDDARNRKEAVQPILDGFKWLGVDWDEGPTDDASGESFGPHKPYFQGQRNPIYEAAAMKLLAEGKAYPDYTTPEQQEAAREQAKLARKPYVHRGTNRDVPAEENVRQYAAKKAPLLLKVDPGKRVKFEDAVKGKQDVNTDTIRDPMLLRGPDEKGLCRAVYNFATVVDDIDFGITHIVRAVEHLENTPTQILMYEALEAKLPTFGHVPQVYYNGEKMSKRKTPPLSADEIAKFKACGWTDDEIKGRDDLNIIAVAYYQEIGYLPEALINYLCRLGWSMDGESEFIPLEKLKANFSLERVTDAPGNYDAKKLFWLQGEYMKLVPTAEKVEKCMPFLKKAKLIDETLDDATRATLTKIIEASGDRIKLFSDVLAYALPILKSELTYDEKGVEKAFKDANAKALLAEFADVLRACVPFDAPTTDKAAHEFVAAKGLKLGALQLPLRIAITGVTTGFGVFDTLSLLGKERSLSRIAATLKRVG